MATNIPDAQQAGKMTGMASLCGCAEALTRDGGLVCPPRGLYVLPPRIFALSSASPPRGRVVGAE